MDIFVGFRMAICICEWVHLCKCHTSMCHHTQLCIPGHSLVPSTLNLSRIYRWCKNKNHPLKVNENINQGYQITQHASNTACFFSKVNTINLNFFIQKCIWSRSSIWMEYSIKTPDTSVSSSLIYIFLNFVAWTPYQNPVELLFINTKHDQYFISYSLHFHSKQPTLISKLLKLLWKSSSQK